MNRQKNAAFVSTGENTTAVNDQGKRLFVEEHLVYFSLVVHTFIPQTETGSSSSAACYSLTSSVKLLETVGGLARAQRAGLSITFEGGTDGTLDACQSFPQT